MFFLQRPSADVVARFLRTSEPLALSYGPVGVTDEANPQAHIVQEVVTIGQGDADYRRAVAALLDWRQFDLGWTALYPKGASVLPGTIVAVQIRHLGFWSLNGCRVVYTTGHHEHGDRFGVAYGTLPNHAEAGEELFEVSLEPTGLVRYRIRATARPQHVLSFAGRPYVERLQARFRRDSAAAMKRALEGHR